MEKQMNKLVLISGSSRGLGAAMAKSFSEAGYSVAINYFNSEKEAKELSKILPNQSHAFKCNISNKKLTDKIKEEITCKYNNFESFIYIKKLVNEKIIERKLLNEETTYETYICGDVLIR